MKPRDGWWVVLAWAGSYQCWLAHLVDQDAMVHKSTDSQARIRPARTPEDAYRQAARWFRKTGVLQAWVSRRSAQARGYAFHGACGRLNDKGQWTGMRSTGGKIT